MKKITLTVLLLLSVSILSAQEDKKTPKVFGKTISKDKISPDGHIRCATDEYEAYLQSIDPKRKSEAEFEAWLAPLMAEYKNNTLASQSGGIITIPVVVHVIHNGDAYGVNENITDEQVASQITVMNQDFRKMMGTPGFGAGVDTQVQFALAKVDPNGNPTDGINRVNLCEASWSTGDINGIVKPATIWDATQYMNMWSVNFTDGSLLGYAQFPDGSGLGGLNPSGGAANTDGVVAGYRFFGSSDLASGSFQAPYDKGRTMTHEVGHWIGLRHIWGDGGCAVDDFCADTPAAAAANFGCPEGTNSCSAPGNDMIENYMDYTDDSCMNIFTQNQKDRMVVIMNNAARRASLKTSVKDIAIPLFANDAEVKIETYCTTGGNPCVGNSHKIILYNRGTSNLTSAAINYNVNGGTNTTYNWTGNLAPNKYEIITITTVATSGTFNASVASVNGGTDQRATNDTASRTFSFPPSTPPTDYPYTTFTLDIVGDRYGSETTWQVTNQAGTVLYNGGPYSDLGSNTTQPLVTNLAMTLPAGGCYTFTIFDAYGDGICCTYGSGSWTVKTNAGATTVGTGGTFTNVQSTSFTNASLSSDSFNLDAISLYPNPTNGILNVSVPSEFGTDINYEIFNNIGQTIEKSKSTNSEFSINTSSMSSGVYFIKLQTEAGLKTLRFVKN